MVQALKREPRYVKIREMPSYLPYEQQISMWCIWSEQWHMQLDLAHGISLAAIPNRSSTKGARWWDSPRNAIIYGKQIVVLCCGVNIWEDVTQKRGRCAVTTAFMYYQPFFAHRNQDPREPLPLPRHCVIVIHSSRKEINDVWRCELADCSVESRIASSAYLAVVFSVFV